MNFRADVGVGCAHRDGAYAQHQRAPAREGANEHLHRAPFAHRRRGGCVSLFFPLMPGGRSRVSTCFQTSLSYSRMGRSQSRARTTSSCAQRGCTTACGNSRCPTCAQKPPPRNRPRSRFSRRARSTSIMMHHRHCYLVRFFMLYSCWQLDRHKDSRLMRSSASLAPAKVRKAAVEPVMSDFKFS